ncbi:unnamed protein product [Rotaria sp. Silwood2]|nr:unnamed protein product [Rotaria sp. Silwood2]
MSVAELVRKFNTQVNPSSLENQQAQQSSYDQDRNDQGYQRNVTRHKTRKTSFSTTQNISNNRKSNTQVNNRTRREQPSSIVSNNYSPVTTQLTSRQTPHSYNHDQYSLKNYQNSVSHDSFKYVIPPQEQAYGQGTYTQITLDESDAFNHNLALQVQYPSKVLFNEASERYSPQHMSIIADNDFSNMKLIDIRHVLNLAEQDYLHSVQPYVSSVKFKKNYEDDPVFIDIRSRTIATIPTDYTRQNAEVYHRQVPARQGIDTNDFSSYEEMQSHPSFTDHQYSSVDRRKRKRQHHAQASPPIHVSEPSNTVDTRPQTDSK